MRLQGACSKSCDRGEDLIRGFHPAEWLGLRIVRINVRRDGPAQHLWTRVRSAAEGVLGEKPKEPLDLVEPRAMRRSEVQVEARMTLQPSLYRRCLVRGEIIQDDVNAEIV